MAQTAILLLLAATLLTAQPARFGLPACSPSHHELADHAYFLLCHDPALKVSRWVAYERFPQPLHHLPAPCPSRFRPDPQQAHPPPRDTDKPHSGFSPGPQPPPPHVPRSPQAPQTTL
ncbi:MAG: hypothetical protein SFV54_05495, partial [Bryobacteraceae bacterium]|nr:hypothetical protein [Bryobacteraceae bacterium]